jgi:hypothetical protein
LDPSFAEFKKQLLKAIETQDREFLRGALGEVQFGFEAPIPADRAMETFDQHKGASWEVLQRLLLMGVKRLENGRFYAPYVSYAIARDRDFNDRTDLVITDKDVELYAEPTPNASVIALLSYDIVEFDRKAFPPSGWFKITTIPDRQTGYIRRKYGYRIDSVRVSFAKQDGKWKLISFQGGD